MHNFRKSVSKWFNSTEGKTEILSCGFRGPRGPSRPGSDPNTLGACQGKNLGLLYIPFALLKPFQTHFPFRRKTAIGQVYQLWIINAIISILKHIWLPKFRQHFPYTYDTPRIQLGYKSSTTTQTTTTISTMNIKNTNILQLVIFLTSWHNLQFNPTFN